MKKIAGELFQLCKKIGKITGKYRTRKVKVIAGKKTKKTVYRESGCSFHVDIEKVFFSPRLMGERARIAGLIKPGETVGAFFAGVGPYPIVFAKHSKMEKAFAIELNREAVKLMKKNIELNKVEGKVIPLLGDVKKLSKKIAGKCDRVVMPMPKCGEDFLEAAFTAAKQKAVIHFYHFVLKDEGFDSAIEKIGRACKKHGIEYRVLDKRIVLSSSPSKIEVVIDFSVAKRKNLKNH